MRLGRVIWILVAALLVMPFPALADDPPADEKAVLAQLFALNRKLDESRAAIARVEAEIATVEQQQERAQAERDRLEGERSRRQEQFGRRVRFYHEQGQIAPFAFVFGARTFPEFLSRVEALGLVLAQDASLLRSLKEVRAAVEQQERTLAEQRQALTKLREDQAGAARQLEQEIAEKEAILAGLKERRTSVEAQLDELERRWNADARPVLDALGGALQSLANNLGTFQPDTIDISLFPPGATVHISDKTLNQFFGKVSELKGLRFRMPSDRVNLEGEFGGTHLRIEGRFVQAGATVLRYEPLAIYVQEFQAPETVLGELTSSGRLDIDLGPLIKPWSLKEVRMEEGKLLLKTGLK